MKKVLAAVLLLVLGVIGSTDVVKALVVPTALCAGATASLTDTAAIGVWSSGNMAVATVGTDGVVTGVSSGSVIITYTLDTTVVLFPLTIDTPLSPVLVVDSLLCAGDSVWVLGSPAGGSWLSKDMGVAIFTAYGMTAISAGTDSVFYTATNACGTYSAEHVVTVNASPESITLPSAVCWGDTVLGTDAVPGGTWSTAYGYAVTAGTNGFVGVAPGVETVTYTLPGGCFTTSQLTVARPASAIAGDTSVCTHSIVELSDSSLTGVWSSSDVSILRVVAGYVLGVTPGTATISYNDTNVCGTYAETFHVTVLPTPPAIMVADILCMGTTYLATDDSTGGLWSSAHGVVDVDATGEVIPVTIGTDLIRYTTPNGCSITKNVTVSAVPSAIVGDTIACLGVPATLADTLADGIWSITAGTAAYLTSSISTTILTGTDTGTVNIAYTNACGHATFTVAVRTSPTAGTITGATSVCQGASISLHDSVAGGIWETRFDSVATIGATGIVFGASGGITLVVYRVANSCGSDSAYTLVTVNPKPLAGTIVGPDTVCIFASLVLTDTTATHATGSVWGVTNSRLSIISEGTFYGAAPGFDTVYYKVTNTCGMDSASKPVFIKMYPIVAAVTGTPVFCAGSTVTFSDATPGGTWSVSDPSPLLISGGIATAINGGLDTVLYSVTNSCATVSSKFPVTINPLPMPGIITFPDSVCPGIATVLVESGTGGTWSDFNGKIAISADTATGLTPGLDTLYYTVSNICGTEIASKYVWVKTQAHAAALTGIDSVCLGHSTTLSDSVTGGMWLVSNHSATVTGGIVTGTAAGYDTVHYVVSGCGTDTVSMVIETLTTPVVANITGSDSICIESSVVLSDLTPDGTWTVGGTAVSLSGTTITGQTVGTDTVHYTVSNVCGSTRKNLVVTVLAAPSPSISLSSISNALCVGHELAATGSPVGGTWSLTNSVMNVAGGIVAAATFGTDTLIYTVANICATVQTTIAITADTVLAPYISGRDYVCVGAADTINAFPAGGTWNITNSNASISDGILHGSTGGLDTVYYAVANACGLVQTAFAVAVFTKDQCDSINGVQVVLDYIEGISLYPNPAKDYVVAEGIMFGTDNLEVKFIDLQGHLVVSGTAVVNTGGHFKYEIDLPKNIANGVYMLTIGSGNRRQTFPISVQH